MSQDHVHNSGSPASVNASRDNAALPPTIEIDDSPLPPPVIHVTNDVDRMSLRTSASEPVTAQTPEAQHAGRQSIRRLPSVQISRERRGTVSGFPVSSFSPTVHFSDAESGPSTPSAAVRYDTLSPRARTRSHRSYSVGTPLPSPLSAEPITAPTTRPRSSTVSSRWRNTFGGRQSQPPLSQSEAESLTSAAQPNPTSDPMYSQYLVDLLDVIDPEVSTVSTLSNVQNSLFVPNIGFNRSPTIKLSPWTSMAAERYTKILENSEEKSRRGSEESAGTPTMRPRRSTGSLGTPAVPSISEEADGHLVPPSTTSMHRSRTVMSVEGRYAVLPHDMDWSDWTEDEQTELDEYVYYLLSSKKEKARRRWRGFRKFASKPLGFLVTLYFVLITFWGAAWVLFLIGWLNVGNRQDYFIEICDQILTALFCCVGIGMAPFRAVDTYRMIYIAHYHRLALRLRKEKGLPDLPDPNDLPEQRTSMSVARLEEGRRSEQTDEEILPVPVTDEEVLTPEQQAKFLHHQTKFCHSHTFYKPHETYSHYAFRLDLLIVIVCLLDCHSLFQMALGGTTWGIYYKRRPHALTAVILACSLSCNITAGIIISIGDHLSRKKEVLERQLRRALTIEALERKSINQKVEERKRNEMEAQQAQKGFDTLQQHNLAQADQEMKELNTTQDSSIRYPPT